MWVGGEICDEMSDECGRHYICEIVCVCVSVTKMQ